jgi:hypothetical protein
LYFLWMGFHPCHFDIHGFSSMIDAIFCWLHVFNWKLDSLCRYGSKAMHELESLWGGFSSSWGFYYAYSRAVEGSIMPIPGQNQGSSQDVPYCWFTLQVVSVTKIRTNRWLLSILTLSVSMFPKP